MPNEYSPYQRIFFLSAMFFVALLVLFSLSSTGTSNENRARAEISSKNEPPRDLVGVSLFPEPDLDAEAYSVRFFGDTKPLFSRRQEKKLPPASLTKLLTAFVAQEIVSPSDLVFFSEFAKTTEPPISAVRASDAMSRDDAIRIMLVSSANDAARALAEAAGANLGGTNFSERVSLFTDSMNRKAKDLGMRHSHFENPNGFDAIGHVVSAEDLSRLAEIIWIRYPELFRMTQDVETTIQGSQPYLMLNTNELLTEFPAIRGGKTGFTEKARGTLLLLYPAKNGKTAVIVLLGSSNRFEDGRKVLHWLDAYNEIE